MDGSGEHCHSVTALVRVPAAAAFEFMKDPVALGRWSLGCMNTRAAGPEGLYAGTSLFDGSPAWFEIEADPHRLLIDYHVGTKERRSSRISARVIPAEVCDLPAESCYVTLTAWRGSAMDDERWHRLRAAHDAEILLIKAQCEAVTNVGNLPLR